MVFFGIFHATKIERYFYLIKYAISLVSWFSTKQKCQSKKRKTHSQKYVNSVIVFMPKYYWAVR